MGAWGAGGFENDTALDFVATVERVDDLIAAFASEPGEKIDADRACTIIAAAECVAAMLGRPADDIPEDLAERLKGFGKPDSALLETTRNFVAVVIADSELSELWAEADNPADFNLAMTGLIDRLNPDIKPKARKGRKKKPLFNPSPCAFCNRPMGEEEFGMFDLSVDLGTGDPIRLGKWAHLACLNARLHPSHIVQVWKSDPEAIQAEVDRLFGDDTSDD
ncbi:MAG TPA: DUF4259 domain-containing protein [Sinorhizobium sp.]|nr:DUF4259 domain-containing protein [Sinorhizobium sp.]